MVRLVVEIHRWRAKLATCSFSSLESVRLVVHSSYTSFWFLLFLLPRHFSPFSHCPCHFPFLLLGYKDNRKTCDHIRHNFGIFLLPPQLDLVILKLIVEYFLCKSWEEMAGFLLQENTRFSNDQKGICQNMPHWMIRWMTKSPPYHIIVKWLG